MTAARTRRSLLGNTIAGLATGAVMGGIAVTVATPEMLSATPAPHPDAELLGLCDRVVTLEKQWVDAGAFDEPAGTPRMEAAYAEQIRLHALADPLIKRITELPTHTLEGFRARAHAILCSDYGEIEKADGSFGMVWSLLNDLTDGAWANNRETA